MKHGRASRRAFVALLAMLLIFLQTGSVMAGGYTTRMAIVNEATRHLGEPYEWGSGWPPGFDCSGFINYIMMTSGVRGFYCGPYSHGPTVDIQALNYSYPISIGDLAPGDLVFLDRSYDTNYDGILNYQDTWSHIGVYEGNGSIIQAGGGSVSRRQLTAWMNLGYNPYAISFAGARRVNTSLWPNWDPSFNAKEGIEYFSGDFSGDGKDDVVAFQDYTRAATGIWSYTTKATGVIDISTPANITFTPSLTWLSDNWSYDWSRAKSLSLDFDGDGKTDIVSFYNYGGTTTGVFFFKSTGTGFVQNRLFVSPSWDWTKTKPVAGDFNGDGKQEIIAFYSYGGTKTAAWLFERDSSGGLKTPRMIFFSPYWDWKATTLVAGKSAGGTKDTLVAVYNYWNATTGFWPFSMDAAGNLTSPGISVLTSQWDAARSKFLMTDFDGDGREDLISFYNYGGTNMGIWYFASTGTGLSQPVKVFFTNQYDWSRSSFLPGDFNGDGKGEVTAMYNYMAGSTSAFLFVPRSGSFAVYPHVWYAP